MPLHLQRVLVISCVFRSARRACRCARSSTARRDGASQEGERHPGSSSIASSEHRPQLVSWNGGGFDLPVLQQRGLRHGVVAGKYWDMGDDDREYRYNNYISRYHLRHIDLMDLLAMYQPRGNAPLDAMAKLCGFPGKLGMDGSQVYGAYLEGRRDEIRRYCETDAMNTYLLWCRFEKMRGRLDEAATRARSLSRATTVGALDEPHWREYLAAWPRRATRRARPRRAEERRVARPPTRSPDRRRRDRRSPRRPSTTTTETTIYIDSSSIRA